MKDAAIRPCGPAEFHAILSVINDASEAYRGVIPDDCWKEPYMPEAELRGEIAAGVDFWGLERGGSLAGVMGIQPVKDVTLIRHAYVRSALRRRGVGANLLRFLRGRIDNPILIGTWAAATWAISFYEKHGFSVVPATMKDRLLRLYWTVPPRQIEASVVLAEAEWLDRHQG